MTNSSINDRLSSIAEVEDGDVVLEIGPGTGSLTSVLINAGATVIAVEKDPRMAALVAERFQETDRFMVLQEDLTKCRVESHVSQLLENRRSGEGLINYAKVVANIPFNISTEIIKRILPLGDIFSDVVLLLQHETALRLTDSQLRSSDYRAINIFVNFFSDAEYQFKVDRKNFFPEPNVDGAVVKFKLRRPADYPAVGSVKDFFSMVNSAFNGKRKMLRKSLQHLRKPHEIEEALSFAGLPVTARPEELSLNDFVSLHNSLTSTHQ
ncbi:ribosomal RNA adenine dimethylase family protein isoform X2 [Wolffia australiana]